MSISLIKNILEGNDFREQSQTIRKEIELANKILLKPRELNDRKMFRIYRILGLDAERKISKKHLNDFQFLIMNVLEKPSDSRFNQIKNYYELKEEDIQMIKFIINPKKFPPGGYVEGLKKYNVEFYSSDIILKKLQMKDYIDLYSLLRYIPLDYDNPFVQNLVKEILSLNPLESKPLLLKRMKELYEELNDIERQILLMRIGDLSYYHYRLLVSEKIKGVVIDGSNVIRYNNYNKFSMLLELLDNLYIENIVFFPVIVVFDNNIEYCLNQEDKDSLKLFAEKERVLFNSPADEVIIHLANKFDYSIISNDKFRDYQTNKERLFEIRRFINV